MSCSRPGCGGALETGVALKTLDRAHYFCSLCVDDCPPTLDTHVEVTFTVNPRIRRIAAHDPDSLPLHEYARQIFWGTLIDLPQDFQATRYHSLIVERKSLPQTLEISAETADGIIMGLRHRKLRVEGVQFHPESVLTGPGFKLLENFLSI